MKIFKGEKTIVKSWCENPESGAIDQAKNLASLPFVYKHIALMPDTHEGKGMPIGGVMATDGIIVPNAVGVDIGCGMCAVKVGVQAISKESLKVIMGEARKQIPVGFGHHKQAQEHNLMPKRGTYMVLSDPVIAKEYDSAMRQIGTLGGGNHFIEIQKGSDGYIYLMIHSGSRNIGLKVATHYHKVAQELNKKWASSIPPSWGLAFLPIDSDEGRAYMRAMNYCVEFALANRKLMMDRLIKIVNNVIGGGDFDVDFGNMINIAHNYAALEYHFGKEVVVHRKGATQAMNGQYGIIPGSQGTKSYIVLGKGNPDSFNSCSHGAGRKLSRKKAKEILDLEEQKKIMDDLGVVHGIRNVSDLDEAPGSYKDINIVMEEQKDLVEVLVELSPLAVIKG